MLFSVIIPTYNRAYLLTETINSILNQTFQDFEIIIVDDGSTDDTESIIEDIKSNKIKYYKTKNNGVASARNYGINIAKGKYLNFLDSDDKVKENHLLIANDYLKENIETNILHLNYVIEDNYGKIISKNTLPKNMPVDIFKGCSMHVNCVFIKNEIAKNNLFNESKDLMFAEDWDFFIKLSVKYPIKFINELTVKIIDHGKRSMRDFDLFVWKKRRNALIQSLLNDTIVSKKYKSKIKNVNSHMNSLIALNCILSQKKMDGIKYFFISISENPRELFTRRTLAIIKHLLF